MKWADNRGSAQDRLPATPGDSSRLPSNSLQPTAYSPQPTAHSLQPTACRGGRAARGRRGFTLIELLAVIVIIAILVGLSLAGLNAARIKAWRVKARDTARQLVQSWNLYLQDMREFPPPTAFEKDDQYGDTGGFPSSKKNLGVLNEKQNYIELSATERDDYGLRDKWGRPFYFILDNGDGGDVAYDGYVKNPSLKPDTELDEKEKRARGNVIVWSLGEAPGAIKENRYQWVVQW